MYGTEQITRATTAIIPPPGALSPGESVGTARYQNLVQQHLHLAPQARLLQLLFPPPIRHFLPTTIAGENQNASNDDVLQGEASVLQ